MNIINFRTDTNTLKLFTTIFILLFTVTVAADEKNTGDIIVDIEWLIAHKEDKQLLIIDARKREEYLKGHIPGAINIPVATTFSPEDKTGRVGKLQYISKLFSDAGVRHDNTIVVYDDNTYIDAARMVWVFEVHGHNGVKLFNGGFDVWQADKTLLISTQDIKPTPSIYIPRVNPDRVISKFSMRLAVANNNNPIIDGRTADEYSGKNSKAIRFGHIPNAINIPAKENLIKINSITMLKPLDELKARYNDIAKDKKVYAYCNRGKESSLTYTVLRQLGQDVAHYDGSWIEWGNDETLPITSPKQ